MSSDVHSESKAMLRDIARPISGAAGYDGILRLIRDAQFVLIGEASHGTEEFYATRAELTLRLIQEIGFRVVALEADWPVRQ